MGKLKVIKTGPITTIQDFGRFGFRKYGIPQSGAMDSDMMVAANRSVGNPDHYPVIEFAISGLILVAEEKAVIAIVGAHARLNDSDCSDALIRMDEGDQVEIAAPTYNYGYIAIAGRIAAQKDFESYATYVQAGFGGIEGRALVAEDVLLTNEDMGESKSISQLPDRKLHGACHIHFMKGPEWETVKELPESKVFQIDSTSNRMGIRLRGNRIESDYSEIASSAVIPGVIQLPSDGHPIILMNDCQTTGGYPRIGKVIDEDLPKLAQVKHGQSVILSLISD